MQVTCAARSACACVFVCCIRRVCGSSISIADLWCFLQDEEYFRRIKWRYVVVDEAHALKNKEALLHHALQTSISFDSLLLLTGTPFQNGVRELWSLLNLIDKEKYKSVDEFEATFGDLRASSQVAALQQELKPIMLQRRKEHVEKSIPPKVRRQSGADTTATVLVACSCQRLSHLAFVARAFSHPWRGCCRRRPSSTWS